MTRLTLDQCENLKKWGMPQRTYLSYWEVNEFADDWEWKIADERDEFLDCPVRAVIACPTLEELLEWLGDDFNQMRNMHDGEGYQAYNYGEPHLKGAGNTPLEAVYELAEALHASNGEK